MEIRQKILKNIVFLFILFSFVKLEIDIITIEDDGHTYPKNGYLELGIKAFEKSSYLKITVKGESVNYVISYYQDNSLKERKQMAQSLRQETVMWLNSQQTKDDFFITVECADKEYSYDLIFEKTNEAQLNLNEQYTYYVTEKNENMKFKLLKGESSSLVDLSHVSVWVRSNNGIKTNLGGEESEQKLYSYYEIKSSDYKKNENDYYLTINGKSGDLINVGLIFYYNCISNVCHSNFTLENGEEITSFIGPASEQSFKASSPKENIGYYYDINNKILKGNMDSLSNINLNMKTINDSLFYTMQYINDTNYDGKGNNKYSPLLDGIYNIKQINQNSTIGLIPMKPRSDSNFLIYEVFPMAGDISVSIYECDNYPFCHLNKLDNTKLKKIDNYQSYYYSYNNDDLKNISPISKNQKMLLITCKEGLNILDKKTLCSSIINMRTDNNIIDNTDFNLIFPPYPRFIKENNIDKYVLNATDNPIHLYIETITGDIEIEINGNPKDIQDNFYVIKNPNEDTKIKIRGKKNSIYSIKNNYYPPGNPGIFSFQIGFNYIIKLEKGKDLDLIGVEKLEKIFTGVLQNNYQYFLKISPLNCNIKVKPGLSQNSTDLTKDKFFQNKFFLNGNIIKINGVEDDNCLLHISSYNLNETIYSQYSHGIKFRNNTSQIFTFNKNNTETIFSFPHTELENDVEIKFEQLEEKKIVYSYNIGINGIFLKGSKFNNDIEIIRLEAKEIKEKCNSEFICKILSSIKSEDENTESGLKITITSVIKKEDENIKPSDKSETDVSDDGEDKDDDDDDKKLIIIFSIIGAVILIAIAIGVYYYYYKRYSRNKDITAAVNQISFKDNDKNRDDDEIGDSLLD